jgi:hypothetical protein
MFLKEKFMPDGGFLKLKSRLVAGGDMQDRSLYSDVSSPTSSITSVFMALSIAAHEERHVATADIAGAYLNAKLDTVEVLMYLDATQSALLCKIKPEYGKYLLKDGRMVVKLEKALYGCIESGKLWYNHIKTTLEELGFVANPEDECVFNKGDGNQQCTIVLYVDDLLITCKVRETINATLASLKAKYKDVQEHVGTKHSYLGMSMDFTFRRQRIGRRECIRGGCVASLRRSIHSQRVKPTAVGGPSQMVSL